MPRSQVLTFPKAVPSSPISHGCRDMLHPVKSYGNHGELCGCVKGNKEEGRSWRLSISFRPIGQTDLPIDVNEKNRGKYSRILNSIPFIFLLLSLCSFEEHTESTCLENSFNYPQRDQDVDVYPDQGGSDDREKSCRRNPCSKYSFTTDFSRQPSAQ